MDESKKELLGKQESHGLEDLSIEDPSASVEFEMDDSTDSFYVNDTKQQQQLQGEKQRQTSTKKNGSVLHSTMQKINRLVNDKRYHLLNNSKKQEIFNKNRYLVAVLVMLLIVVSLVYNSASTLSTTSTTTSRSSSTSSGNDLFDYYNSWVEYFSGSNTLANNNKHIDEDYEMNIFKYFKMSKNNKPISESYLLKKNPGLKESLDNYVSSLPLINSVTDISFYEKSNLKSGLSSKQQQHSDQGEERELNPNFHYSTNHYSEMIKQNVIDKRLSKALSMNNLDIHSEEINEEEYNYDVNGNTKYQEFNLLDTQSVWLPFENVFLVSSLVEFQFDMIPPSDLSGKTIKIKSNHVLLQIFDEHYNEINERRLFYHDFIKNYNPTTATSRTTTGKSTIQELSEYLKFIDSENNFGSCNQYSGENGDRLKFDKCMTNSLKVLKKFEENKQSTFDQFSIKFPIVLDTPLEDMRVLKRNFETLNNHHEFDNENLVYSIGPQSLKMVLDSENSEKHDLANLHLVMNIFTTFVDSTTTLSSKGHKSGHDLKVVDVQVFKKVNSVVEFTKLDPSSVPLSDLDNSEEQEKMKSTHVGKQLPLGGDHIFEPLVAQGNYMYFIVSSLDSSSEPTDSNNDINNHWGYLKCSLEDGLCFNEDILSSIGEETRGEEILSLRTPSNFGFNIVTNFLELPMDSKNQALLGKLIKQENKKHNNKNNKISASNFYTALIEFNENHSCGKINFANTEQDSEFNQSNKKYGLIVVSKSQFEGEQMGEDLQLVYISKPLNIEELNKNPEYTVNSLVFVTDHEITGPTTTKKDAKNSKHKDNSAVTLLGVHISKHDPFKKTREGGDEADKKASVRDSTDMILLGLPPFFNKMIVQSASVDHVPLDLDKLRDNLCPQA